MRDNELLLFDRLEIIKTVVNKYGENQFYISFSGGKDSTVLHHLVDMALPNNKIPRVYSNTGIEYLKVVEFVKKMAKDDKRFIILTPTTNIKKTLKEKGYPFKSKEYSKWLNLYQKNSTEVDKYMDMIDKDKTLLDDFNFIHNLPKGVKTAIKSYYGIRERVRHLYRFATCP